MTEKEWHVDFEEWIITAKTEKEVWEKIEARLCDGDIPRVSSIQED